ncbi:hypothetical protein EV421DRAFT_1739906 [Armillaria borealis]|uniref:Uncharacterized protein n=1 Tax=Armillaria borealis TaxID=47425 RepID=A0AA39J484_9AGAR|nr:hypothetical protein EV421DRAFT_1739906 [Armillaria borealis]
MPSRPSKHKQIDSSPVPVSVEVSPEPEHVPRKKNKIVAPVTPSPRSHRDSTKRDSSIKSSHHLLPTVTITSRQSQHTQLRRKVSYGDLSQDEVDDVALGSDMDDSELSASSLRRHGHRRMLFVDNEASERSGESTVESENEVEHAGDDTNRSDTGSVEVIQSCTSISRSAPLELSDSEPVAQPVKTRSSLSSGNVADVADDDDVKKDPSVSSSTRSKLPETQVYLEDLPTPKPPTRSKAKTPLKPSSSGTMVKSKSDAKKKKALADNCRLQVEVSVDPVSKALSKSVSLSVSKPKKIVSQEADDDGNACVTPPNAHGTAKSAPAAIDSDSDEPLASKPSKSTKASKLSKVSNKASTRKSKGKDKAPDPLFLPSDDDTPLSPAVPPMPSTTASSDLAALLGDAAVRSSSPELDLDAPVLCLPESSGYSATAALVEPEDPALRVMQPHLMEDHLVTLGAYLDLPQLGFYQILVPIGIPPDDFDPLPFHSFDDVAKLFCVESLVSLLEFFKWASYGCYVNMGCAAPSLLSLEGKTAWMGDSTAVCMTVGLVTECNLFHPFTQSGYGRQAGKRVRRIRIMPMHQWFRRESMSWGVLFDLDYLETTCLSERGVSFPTRVEDQSGQGNTNSKFNGGGSNFSPAKRGRWRTPTKNVSSAVVSPGQGYPTSLGFGDEGNHFLFRPSDFAVLKLLPCFTTTHDLDVFTLVSEGHLDCPGIVALSALYCLYVQGNSSSKPFLPETVPDSCWILLDRFHQCLTYLARVSGILFAIFAWICFLFITLLPFRCILRVAIRLRVLVFSMVLFTLVDVPFDDDLEDSIIADIDAYNDGLNDRELLDHIDDGDHYYYQHLEHLAHISRSLFDYHYLITESPTYIDPLLRYYIPDNDRLPSSSDDLYLPADMWTRVFSLLAREQLPMLHLTITFSNWSFSPYCFFLHSFSNIQTVRFIADPRTPATIPHIPYPYLLPSSVRHLVVHRCSLHSHSVEGMLSPDTSLESLELIGLEHGDLYLPSVVGPTEISTWFVRIDFSRNAILHVLYHNDPLSSVDMAANMLTQLFRTQSFRADMSPMLLSTQQFPLVLRCNMVTYLDVLVIHNLFSLVSGALADVQFSLRELDTHYEGDDYVLHSSLWRIHLECILGDPDGVLLPSQHFGGKFRLQLATQVGCKRRATVLPIEVTMYTVGIRMLLGTVGVCLLVITHTGNYSHPFRGQAKPVAFTGSDELVDVIVGLDRWE